VRLLAGALVLGAFAAFLPLLVSAVLYAVRAKGDGRQNGVILTPPRPNP
jgi:hypothetical protein